MPPSDPSDKSDSSDPSDEPLERLLPKHGGYRRLRSFQVARLAYDGTVIFCDRFVGKRSRTHDQMVQAARSGVQNIAEGSVASGTSKKTELKLTNVARASLDELVLDFEDFLRQRRLRQWPKDSPPALAVRRRYDSSDHSAASALSDFQTASAEVAANTLICLVNQASFLLGRQLARLDRDFLEHGGFTERLHTMRTRTRQPDPAPACPLCQKPMVRRTARQGSRAGQPFWGCSTYPQCRGTRPFTPSDPSAPSGSSDQPRP